MTVTVAWRTAPRGVAARATSGGGKGESVVQAAPSGGVPDASHDTLSAAPTQDDRLAVLHDLHDLHDLDADAGVAALYRTHWTPMVRLATLLTRDASVAEELVQDSFVALHRRWSALADRGAAHGYLRTSVVNRARSALRHRGVEEKYRQPGAPAPAGPEERAVQADSDARVMVALRTLSRRQQEVLVLRYYGDYSEQDIAATLGLSKGAVKSHAHRGLAALRAALASSDADSGSGEEVPR